MTLHRENFITFCSFIFQVSLNFSSYLGTDINMSTEKSSKMCQVVSAGLVQQFFQNSCRSLNAFPFVFVIVFVFVFVFVLGDRQKYVNRAVSWQELAWLPTSLSQTTANHSRLLAAPGLYTFNST